MTDKSELRAHMSGWSRNSRADVQAGPKLVRVRMNCVRVNTADRGRPIFIGVDVRVEHTCKNGARKMTTEEGAHKDVEAQED
jgi:hypothetical protein